MTSTPEIGFRGLYPVYVHERPYWPGDEIPVEDELGMAIGNKPTGFPSIEIFRNPDQRFQNLGRGPTRSELQI